MPKPVAKTATLLDAVNALVEDVSLPAEFALALMSGRPELAMCIRRPNGLNAEETAQVAHALGVLLRTNQALQDHVKRLAEQVEHLHGHAKGLMGKIDLIGDMANFRQPIDTTDEY